MPGAGVTMARVPRMAWIRTSPSRAAALLAPVHVPPAAALGPVTRLRLVVEILGAYPRLWRLVRSNDLVAMVAQARLARPGRARVRPEESERVALRLGACVERVLAPLPTDSRCLITSLVVLRMLARRSIEARVVIGARTDSGFAAHAWVEHGARPILPVGQFTRLVEL